MGNRIGRFQEITRRFVDDVNEKMLSKEKIIGCLKVDRPGGGGGGGVLTYMGHIGMCRCEGYGFQAVYSSIGYINQSVWV